MARSSLCDSWEFTRAWSDAFARFELVEDAVPARLPHAAAEVPLHCADPADYEMVCGYRRRFAVPSAEEAPRLFLVFDGAAHQAEVYVNGQLAGAHRGGYTSFELEITDLVDRGAQNELAVKLDTREDPALPPFGFVIDYLCYGGLYREVWLEGRAAEYVGDVFVTTPTTTSAKVRAEVVDAPSGRVCTVRARIADAEGAEVARAEASAASLPAIAHGPASVHAAAATATAAPALAGSKAVAALELAMPSARAWDLDHPNLYTCTVELLAADGSPVAASAKTVTFGFRTAEWRADGFYLNGARTFLRGLNRHQSYPYVGYAAPASLQVEDARIVKEELACTAVRTSHYPQSHHFLDACDRLGLLVFTEFPGWQHIGDAAWKDQACATLAEMIVQYRNHPSIVLWGVRINESVDDDEFYGRTNAIAHELDPSRATSGVRYLEKSHLLEDVYAFNDFSHNGTNAGCKPKRDVMRETDRALLISECNGHMCPTKACDDWPHRAEHALRHARVLNAALADGQHAGCFEWCLFDYATHKDFGSGDRICYHGVLDSFRNPKLAAAVYASQGELPQASHLAAQAAGHGPEAYAPCLRGDPGRLEKLPVEPGQASRPVLEIGSSMDIGDYPAGQVGSVEVYTNAASVDLYKNDVFVTTLRADPALDSLPHPPLVMDDTIGELLETQEGFAPAQAAAIRDCLNAAARYTLAGLPARYKAKLAYIMLRYHMSFEDGVALYGKYVGNWGGEATRWRFDARDAQGSVVATRTLAPSARLHLEVRASATQLVEGDTYDMAAVRIRVLDENGNLAPYAQLPLAFSIDAGGEGASGSATPIEPIELVGPAVATAEGGMGGTYVRTTGAPGAATLTISTGQTDPVHIAFTVKKEEAQWRS